MGDKFESGALTNFGFWKVYVRHWEMMLYTCIELNPLDVILALYCSSPTDHIHQPVYFLNS